MVAEIKSLDPRPGFAFDPPLASRGAGHLMRRRLDGAGPSSLNAETCRGCVVNNRYYARISRATLSKTEREYLTDRLQAATGWSNRCTSGRSRSQSRHRDSLQQQDGFFPPWRASAAAADPARHRRRDRDAREHGQPGYHHKYIATPRGLFELKYFFTYGDRRSPGGDAHSAEAVRFRIRA